MHQQQPQQPETVERPDYPLICVRCGGDRKRTVTLRVGPLVNNQFEQQFDLCEECIRTLLACVARFIGVGPFPEIDPPKHEGEADEAAA